MASNKSKKPTNKLVIANWKMHLSLDGVKSLVDDLARGLEGYTAATVVLCPPAVHLSEVGRLIRNGGMALGAQDLSRHSADGPYTGEIAGHMLAEHRCQYCIVGHSERRAMHSETDEIVAEKAAAALKAGITPIVCVGEQLVDRRGGRAENIVRLQLEAVFDRCPPRDLLARGLVVAYEPVWAIGSGESATPEAAAEMHTAIRGRLAEAHSQLAKKAHIVYGGSVRAENAADLFATDNVDGGLIGGASLKPDEFISICQAIPGA